MTKSTEDQTAERTSDDQRGLTLVGASTPQGMKEEGGSSSGPALAKGDSFGPGAFGRAPGWGRELLGTSPVWVSSRKGLVREGPAGWAMPRLCSLSISGLGRGKAGAGQTSVPSYGTGRKGGRPLTLRPQITSPGWRYHLLLRAQDYITYLCPVRVPLPRGLWLCKGSSKKFGRRGCFRAKRTALLGRNMGLFLQAAQGLQGAGDLCG